MEPKVIKTDKEYEAALARIDTLMAAKPNTPEGDALELWTFLVEEYEKRQWPIPLPDPISAIRFRMEQGGLKNEDLIPYLGTKGKVSEVLSGKRTLSLTMIRRLHEGLGIPAEVLLQQPGAHLSEKYKGVNWRLYPLAEIVKRQWIPGFTGTWRELLDNAEETLGPFLFQPGLDDMARPACPRQNVRSGAEVNDHALRAWMARILQVAAGQDVAHYEPGSVTEDFIREIARLSQLSTGPLAARELLNKNGIRLVIERHLPGTYLDGMAMCCSGSAPIVALTLRHDRLDNFWFTLCHELSHVALHLNGGQDTAFVDDLDVESSDTKERDADILASECLISPEQWKCLKKTHWSESLVVTTANKLRVDPSVVAGRIRRERDNYKLFTNLIGNHTVRKMFGADN